jgi:prepilin-type N-terminal cleavage/methylation domain-containing protein
MPSARSTQLLNAEQGFSLVEMMVASAIMLSVLVTSAAFFAAGRKTITDQLLMIETLQGLRAAEDSMARDLRLGGACLPTTGDFITLDSVNSTTDQIFTRTGLVDANEVCISTVLTADLTAAGSTLTVQSAAGWAAGMRVYIRQSSGTTGEVFTITSVNTGTNTLQKTTTLTCPQLSGGCPSPAYPSGSSLFAVDERLYSVDTSNSALPVLNVTANGAAATAFAFGITNLQLQYVLAQNCDSTGENCTVVDVPANDVQFALVNQIYVTLTARSLTTLSSGQYYTATRTVSAKPRNLLPG